MAALVGRRAGGQGPPAPAPGDTEVGPITATRPRPGGWLEALSETVFGSPASTFPPPAATIAVTVLLATAALLVTGRAGLWGARMPRWVFSAGAWAVAAVLFLRAAFYGPAAIGSDAINRSWEFALYTPLCLVLALLCAIVARGAGVGRAGTRRSVGD